MKQRFGSGGGAALKEKGSAGPCEQECRIFLVDGNEKDRQLGKAMLEAAHFVESVRCFPSGKALLDYMKAAGFYDRSVLCLTPTLVIVAVEDPADSLRVLGQLKSDPFLQDIPVLAAVRAPGNAAARRAFDLRADGVLFKPLNTRMIVGHADRAWQWPTREMWMN